MEETAQGRQMRGRYMSNYGLKTYTPEQIKEQWRESMKVLVNFSLNKIVQTVSGDLFFVFK